MLKKLLEKELTKAGIDVSTAMCEHIAMSRAQLFEAVRLSDTRTWNDVMDRFGTGTGCDICKPAIASILATITHTHPLDGGLGGFQDTNDRALANMQKDGTYSVVPRVPGGEITPEKLAVIAAVARKYNLYTKLTGGLRIDMFGARLDQLPDIWRELVNAGFESGHAYGKSLRNVKTCVGSTWCRYGMLDSVAMGISLELRYRGLRAPTNSKWVSPDAHANAQKPEEKMSESSPQPTDGTSTSAVTVEPPQPTPNSSPKKSTTPPSSATSTASSCTTFAPPTDSSAPPDGSKTSTVGSTESKTSSSTTASNSAKNSKQQ